jgi:tRNA uridine 5-carboxymethylaminomethyl modification enzyme
VLKGEAASLLMDAARVGASHLRRRRAAKQGGDLATGTFLGGKLFFGSRCERAAARVASGRRQPWRAASRLGLPHRAPEDGDAAPAGRPDDRLGSAGAAAFRHASWTMSPMTSVRRNPQLFCAITRTNAETHRIIRERSTSRRSMRATLRRRPALLPFDRG